MTVADAAPAAPRAKTPVHLWVVGILALLWNFMGVFDYLATQFRWEFYMGQFTEEQLAYFYGFPAWTVAAWAIAVWGSFLGAVALLLRSRWAVWCFGVALAAMAVSSMYTLVLTDGATIMGTGGLIFTAVIWVLQIFLVWYAWKMAQRGVLR